MIVEANIWRIINKCDLFWKNVRIKNELNKADIILTATSAQTNLGDHAISIAELAFFNNLFPRKKVVEIPKEIFYKNKECIAKRMKPDAIVVISGGGFLGDLWMTEENLVREVIARLKGHKIVVMPQTVYFSPNSMEYDESFRYYKMPANIHFNARDMESYNLLLKELRPEQVSYIPDIVLSMKYHSGFRRKDKALLCIRNDKENCLSKEEITELTEILKESISIKETTTIVDHVVPISFREYYLRNKLKEIAQAKLVVTNRLHMMIFSAVTGTPCIAIDNLSHKVSGVYKWIEKLPYVKLLYEVKDFHPVLEEMLRLENSEYDFSLLEEHYKKLKNEFYDEWEK